MEKLKLFWGTLTDERHIGNLYGYKTHNEMLKQYTEKREDIEIVKEIGEADVCLYITTPEIFDDRPDKPTFLFTMFEGTTIPEIYIKNFKKADFLIVPSTWVKTLFSDYFDPNKIFVVPHGVEEWVKYRDRKLRPKHFRYLWIGAANPRKGYQELIYTWHAAGLDLLPQIELYIKTTRVPNVTLQQNRNVILDSRNLSRKELIDLYYEAHCFVFPTRGEGFGLTLAEAMATGLPCIATGCSGETEFFDDNVGWTLKYKMGEADVKSWIHGDMGKTTVAYPEMSDLLDKMAWIHENYGVALIKGKKGSIKIRSEYTWDNSARKLKEAFDRGLSL